MVSGKAWEGLPPGWIQEIKVKNGRTSKVYLEEATGCRFHSKPQVLRHLEKHLNGDSSVKVDRSQHCESVKESAGETGEDRTQRASKTDKEQVNELDELPPGWIKEIKKRKYAGGFVKDTYYTDPVSGYVFRSKKDVQRYLITRDMRSCAVKPKKRDLIAVLNADKRNESDEVPHDGTEGDMPPSPTKEKYKPRNEDFAEDLKAVDDNGFVSHGPAADVLEEKLPENSSSQDSQANLIKSKRKCLNMPQRTSKRLAGLEPEPEKLPLSGLTEQVVHTSAREEPSSSLSLPLNAAVSDPRRHEISIKTSVAAHASDKASADTDHQVACQPRQRNEVCFDTSVSEAHVSQQLDTSASVEIDKITSDRAKIKVETDLENNHIPCLKEQAAQQQTVEQANERQEKEDCLSSQSDLWSDPCFNFAYRTLLGEIPVEDPVALEPFFQPHGNTFFSNGSASCGLPASGVPDLFQNNVLPNIDTVMNSKSVDQSSSQGSHSMLSFFWPSGEKFSRNGSASSGLHAISIPAICQMPPNLDPVVNRKSMDQTSSRLSRSPLPFSRPRGETIFPNGIASSGLQAINIPAFSQNNVPPNMGPVVNGKSMDQSSSQLSNSLLPFFRARGETFFPNGGASSWLQASSIPSLPQNNVLTNLEPVMNSKSVDQSSSQASHSLLPFFWPHGGTFFPNGSASTGLQAISIPALSRDYVPPNSDLAVNSISMYQLPSQSRHSLLPFFRPRDETLGNVNSGLQAVNIPALSPNHVPPNLDPGTNSKCTYQSSSQSRHAPLPFFRPRGGTFFPDGTASSGLPAVGVPALSQNNVPPNLYQMANSNSVGQSSIHSQLPFFPSRGTAVFPNGGASSELPAINAPGLSLYNVPPALDLVLNSGSMDQSSSQLSLSSHSTFLPPANITIPGCSGPCLQPPCLQSKRKDHETKVSS